jgi:chromosomal replication initiation ATPase DnaA
MSGPIARAILAETAADHGLAVAVMLEKVRSPDRVAARFDAMRRLRAVTRNDGRPRFSLPQIGALLGVHHTSVLNGLRRVAQIEP